MTIINTDHQTTNDTMREFHTAAGDRVTAFIERGGNSRTIAIDTFRDEHTIAQARELCMTVLEAAAWAEGRQGGCGRSW